MAQGQFDDAFHGGPSFLVAPRPPPSAQEAGDRAGAPPASTSHGCSGSISLRTREENALKRAKGQAKRQPELSLSDLALSRPQETGESLGLRRQHRPRGQKEPLPLTPGTIDCGKRQRAGQERWLDLSLFVFIHGHFHIHAVDLHVFALRGRTSRGESWVLLVSNRRQHTTPITRRAS